VAAALDLVRLFVGVTLLAFGSYTDWKWRRAPNVLWLIMAAAGVILLAAEAALDWGGFLARWPYLVFIPAFAVIIYVFWYFGLIAGGADAKALMALGVLLPFPLALGDALPTMRGPFPGAVGVLQDSFVLFLIVPLAFLVWNVAHGDLRLPNALLGIRRRGRDVRAGHFWPMEVVREDGTRATRVWGSRMSAEERETNLERIEALGDELVWVNPKVPFLIPLLGGYIAAFVLGDLVMAAVTALIV
jgi:preflagellin peptidase FlaK